MALDIKQKLLTAMYLEYQKDNSNYEENVTPEKLGITKEQFTSAFYKLDNEALVGHDVMYGLAGLSDISKPTLKGIELIEKLFEIKSSASGVRKMLCIGEKLESWKSNHEFLNYIRQAVSEQDLFYKEYFSKHSSFSKFSIEEYTYPEFYGVSENK